MIKKQTDHKDDFSQDFLMVKEENIKLRFNILNKDTFFSISIICSIYFTKHILYVYKETNYNNIH